MRLQVTHCVKWGSELDRGGRGRPSRFCSEGCKKSAEAEMRRINTNLRSLELRRAGLVFGPRAEEARRSCDGPIAELQARYDHLCGAPRPRKELPNDPARHGN